MEIETKRCKRIRRSVLFAGSLVFMFFYGCSLSRSGSSVAKVSSVSKQEAIASSEDTADDKSPGMAVGGSLGLR